MKSFLARCLPIRKVARICAVFLFALLLIPDTVPSTLACENKEISVINYNVAGLPDWGALVGNRTKNVPANQLQLGEQLNILDYDIIAVQEDFGYHKHLIKGLTNYPFATNHSGGIPGGDGLNLYSKFPLFNACRIPWDDTFGAVANGADEMTPKGILYAVIELEDGVFLDFYNIHADAFDDEGSRQARESNFRQLAELINANSQRNDRPVIVTGDFNTYAHIDPTLNSNFCEYLLVQTGLKDAWTEICNNGDYTDYSAWASCGDSWGNWGSVEMILYKSGGGVELEATDFSYQAFMDQDGTNLSDHSAATAKLTYTKTDNFTENSQQLCVTKATPLKNTLRAVKYCLQDLWRLLTNLDELITYFS